MAVLYLLPTPLAPDAPAHLMAPHASELLAQTRLVLAENARTARRYISSLRLGVPLPDYEVIEHNQNSTEEELLAALQAVAQAPLAVYMSEAGAPAVADPGHRLVWGCHQRGIAVQPIPGPSALLLALMACGFGGQRFTFHGYLPIPAAERASAIRQLAEKVKRENSTELFIETPFRSNAMLQALLQHLPPYQRLCVAAHLSSPQQLIISQVVKHWPQPLPDLHKVPCVFLVG